MQQSRRDMQRTWKPPPPPIDQRYAAVAPLPLPFPGHGHYLRRSVGGQVIHQSEGAVSDSDVESDEGSNSASTSSSDSDSDDSSDGSSDASDSDDGDVSESVSSASIGSRSSSQSSLFDSESFSDDDLATDRVDIRSSSYTTSLMSVNATSQRGAFWQTDNLGILGLLIPITGITTMVSTEVLACYNHFDCSKQYPTLSYAAEFKPEGHAFTIGMCATAIFIFCSMMLFHWFVRLKLFHPTVERSTVVMTHACLGAGITSAVSLFGLAVFDMGAYHDTHITFTVVFFIAAWILMATIQACRRNLLRDVDATKLHRPAPLSLTRLGGLSGLWYALQRWKRMSIRDSYKLGSVFLYGAGTATGLFGLFFLCVNGMWPNPLGFTAVQEALLEAFAIVCQLFFMGTLSCELSMLTRVVEHRDYEELERAE